MTSAAPPLPTDPVEARRIEHSRLRGRVLYSMHEADVRARVLAAVGSTRAGAWGSPDMTSNPAWYVTSQLSVLYREIPEVAPPPGGEEVAAAVAEAGYWQLAQRVQRDTIGMNDCFVRVDIDPDTGGPAFRLVPPHMVTITASPLAPSQPLAVAEWIHDGDKWVKLVTDPGRALYMALDDSGRDVSERVLGGDFTGENYPWIINGKPVLPYVAYHAAESGYAMDPYSGREIFEGSLQLGVYYTFFGHILRNAAWGQRWILGAEPDSADLDESGRRKETVTDPATILILRQLEESNGNAQVGQFSPSVDPDRVLAAIERRERAVVEMALSTVGVSRRESDVRSAASLAVSREAQRDAQRAYEPVFRRSDIRLLRLVSGLMGAPLDGWRIHYRSIPRDPQEMQAEVDRMRSLLELGMIDKVTAYQQLHPGLTRDEAEALVKQIADTNASFGANPASGSGAKIALTSTDIASIVTVDEARGSIGLAPNTKGEGDLTVSEFQAKHATVIAAAAVATSGQSTSGQSSP